MKAEEIHPGKCYRTAYDTTLRCTKKVMGRNSLLWIEFECPSGVRKLQPHMIRRVASGTEQKVLEFEMGEGDVGN